MDNTQWFYAQSGQRKGPVPAEELRALAATGALRRDDLVWTAGMAQWAAAGTIADLFEPQIPQAFPAPIRAPAPDLVGMTVAPVASQSPVTPAAAPLPRAAVAADACPHCGAANRPGGAFCEACGKALPTGTPSMPRVLSGNAVPMSSAGHSMITEQLRKEMRKASGALLAVAILQTIFGPVALFLEKEKMEKQGLGPVEIQPIGYVIVFGIAAAFYALWLWSRRSPLPAAIVGLVLFITIHLLDAIADPVRIAQGLIMKIIVIAVLCKAISAALRYRKLLAGEGVSSM